jgi:hypothetical protein
MCPAALNGRRPDADSVFVQKMAVDPMNPETLLEDTFVLVRRVSTSTPSETQVSPSHVVHLDRGQPELPLVPIFGSFS